MTHLATRTPVLGTVVELRIDGDDTASAAAEQAAWDTFEKLESVFSTYRSDSELRRWGSGQETDCSTDLAEVLATAEHWYQVSGGAFHPATRALTKRWQQAAQSGQLPPADQLAELAAHCRLPYTVTEDGPQRLTDCTGVDLNAIAKGYIVDRAAAAAMAVPGITTVVVNAGGDLVHRGAGSLNVGIEDPARPFDNLPPRWQVRVSNAALATSGTARRGFEVGGQWLGHVLDPRTGWPVAHTASISVLALDTMTADALATVVGVLPPGEALAFAQNHSVSCLLVSPSGQVSRTGGFGGEDRP